MALVSKIGWIYNHLWYRVYFSIFVLVANLFPKNKNGLSVKQLNFCLCPIAAMDVSL